MHSKCLPTTGALLFIAYIDSVDVHDDVIIVNIIVNIA